MGGVTMRGPDNQPSKNLPGQAHAGQDQHPQAQLGSACNAPAVPVSTDPAPDSQPPAFPARPEPEPLLTTRPADLRGLSAWLSRWLDLRLPDRVLVEGHTPPLRYLAHAVFDLPGDPVVWANRGGGKTFIGAVATLLDMLFKPGIEIRILAGSLEQSRRMHRHLRALLDPRRHPDLVDAAGPRFTERRLRFANDSEVELLAQSETSVRGTRVQKLRCDEVELFKAEIWEAAQLVTRSKRCGDIEVRGSVECLSTMQRPFGLMHQLIAEARDGRRTLFKWGVLDVLASCGPEHNCGRPSTTFERDLATEPPHSEHSLASSPRDIALPVLSPFPPLSLPLNPVHPLETRVAGAEPCPLLEDCNGRAKDAALAPSGHIPVADAITMRRRVSAARWDSEMMCLHPKRTDAVIPEFDQRVHVFDGEWWVRAGAHPGEGGEHPPRWIGGMDFGFRAPTVILWAVVDARDIVWVVDEHALAGAPLPTHLAALQRGWGRRTDKPWPTLAWIGVDPSGRNADLSGRNAIDEIRRVGLAVRARRSDLAKGFELLRSRLKPAAPSAAGVRGPRLFIHRRCETLIESLERYHFNPDKPQDERPVKDGHDHAVDALRYLIANHDAGGKTASGNYLDGPRPA